MNRSGYQNLHCALKHAYSLIISFVELMQKMELIYNKTGKKEVLEYIVTLHQLRDIIEEIILILEQIYFFKKQISDKEFVSIKVNLRIIRNRLEIETKKVFQELKEIEIKEKDLVENAFFDDYHILMSNLVHLEIHLSYII